MPSTVTLTEAGTAAVGAITASTAVSGANTGAAGATLSVEVANGGTAFTAGQGVFLVTLKNMDTADAIAGIATGLNAVRTAIGNLNDNFAKGTELTNATRSALVTLGLIKGSALSRRNGERSNRNHQESEPLCRANLQPFRQALPCGSTLSEPPSLPFNRDRKSVV